jgi:thioredoxin reductase (NADPH)
MGSDPREREQPYMLVVDNDHASLDATCAELVRRYDADYTVVALTSETAATEALTSLHDRGRALALVLVDEDAAGARNLLTRARTLHPRAKRALLFAPGTVAASDTVPRAAALGLMDFFVIKPISSPDEEFHFTITEQLYEWRRGEPPDVVAVQVVGERGSRRSFEIRDLLERNSVPYAFHAVGSPDADVMLQHLGLAPTQLPIFAFYNGVVLVDPEYHEVVGALGASEAGVGLRDVVIVGGGPAGLAAAVYAASEGLSTLVVEHEAIGGQAGSSSQIRNYLGFPHGVAGRDLAARALRQAWAFGVEFHWMRGATGLRVDGDRRVVVLSDGTEVAGRAVVVASGVSWRRLDVPELEALVGAGVFYGAAVSEASAMQNARVFVVGGGNSAGQAALHLARYAERVTLLVRGSSLAESMSEYLVNENELAKNVELRFDSVVVGGSGDDRLEQLEVQDRLSGDTTTEPADGLFVLIGGEPRTGWLPGSVERDDWGYIRTGDDVGTYHHPSDARSQPLPFETSLAGVFAAGDVRQGSMKRVAAAVGEGASVISSCHRYFDPAPLTR